jgi:hypothetical protein
MAQNCRSFGVYAAEAVLNAETANWLVELSGIEPLTSSLRTTRSPN